MKLLCTGGSGFIGTHFIEVLSKEGFEIINVDNNPPIMSEHKSYWIECNILERDKLFAVFRKFQPTAVVHLAARADIDGKGLADYLVNTQGTENVLDAIKTTSTVSRSIFVSTQFVHKSDSLPKNDEDFQPFTIYGLSKALAEQQIRATQLMSCWTIVRPTIVWGPFHPKYPSELWEILKKHRYIHPGRTPVMRSYGYVGNVVYQLFKILTAPTSVVDRKVFYVGDLPMNQLEWVNGFSRSLTGKDVWVTPKSLLFAFAVLGNVLKWVGVPTPIDVSRFKRMTENYITPMEKTLTAFGLPPYSFAEGVKITVEWLNQRPLK